jgi:hypothetical protein
MNTRRSARFLPLALLLVLCATSCRGAQIRDTEDRVDKLEARVAALEAQVQMLAKK